MFKQLRLIGFCLLSCFQSTYALDLELTQGINSALPIAVNTFDGGEGNAISDVIQHDLKLSGQFKLVGGSGILSITTLRQMGADNVVQGTVRPMSADRFEVNFQLLDAVQKNHVLLNKRYEVSRLQFRALAHHISDEVYEKLTGEKGIFSTRLAYILVKRDGRNARHSLMVSDVDGYNPRSLLTSTEPIMSPAWSPDGKRIAYVSFEKKQSEIYIVTVSSGARQLVSNFKGINGAPTWSPNGQELTIVLSKSGAPKLYSVNLSNGAMKQLTFGSSIDTEPRYSPDAKSIIFTSGRGGAPQIYRLGLESGAISRITFDGNYNARGSFTPNQQQIVLLHRDSGKFNIAVQDVASGQLSLLTSALMDESPSVSPNGRLILYATKQSEQGILGIVSIDGRIHMRLPSGDGDVQEPAWSPYLG
jgi:TolB protein